MFLQDVFKKIKEFFIYLASLSIFTRLLYFSIIVVFINLFVYKLIEFKLIFTLFMLILSEVLRVAISDYLTYKSFNLNFRRNFSNTIDSIAVLILFTEIIFFNSFVPMIFWTKPINLNFRIFSDNYLKILFISFSKSLVSLIIIIASLFVFKYKFHWVNNVYLLQSLNCLFHVNLGLLLLGMIPLSPFDMGIALENLGKFKMRVTLLKIRNYSSFIFFILYYFGVLSNIFNFAYWKTLTLFGL